MASPQSAGDPVPAITEAAATGEIADIYHDIRATLGVPVVNLVWRHLATMPGALPWTWQCVRPLYASGEVAVAAAELRSQLRLPPMPPWPVSVLEAAGLDSAARSGIRRVLTSYDRSNAMNLVALLALQAKAAGEIGTADLAHADPGRDIEEELPGLLTFDQMAPATAEVVRLLNAIGDSEHRVVASMYRHLAHWPPFLALLWERLAPLQQDRRIETIIAENLEIGRGISRRLAARMASIEAQLPADTRQLADAALMLFIHYAIGRMVPIGRLAAKAFPED